MLSPNAVFGVWRVSVPYTRRSAPRRLGTGLCPPWSGAVGVEVWALGLGLTPPAERLGAGRQDRPAREFGATICRPCALSVSVPTPMRADWCRGRRSWRLSITSSRPTSELLALLDLAGATVTLDSLGCKKGLGLAHPVRVGYWPGLRSLLLVEAERRAGGRD